MKLEKRRTSGRVRKLQPPHEDREVSGARATRATPGDAEVMGKDQGRIRAALATDQPQEGRSATDGPDIARVREAAFVSETCLDLPEMEVAGRTLQRQISIPNRER